MGGDEAVIRLRARPFWPQCDKSQGLGGSVPNWNLQREATSWETPVVLFELGRRHVAERRMQPPPVDAFEKLADLHVRVGQIPVLLR